MFQKLASLLGVREDQVDDALKSEQRARCQITRRGLLVAGAAVVAGQLLPPAGRVWSLPNRCSGTAIAWSETQIYWGSSAWKVVDQMFRAYSVEIEKRGCLRSYPSQRNP